MALIHCPECGKEISDTAKFCVNCGFTIQKYLAQQAAQQAEAQRRAAQAEKDAQKRAARAEKAAQREAASAEMEAQKQAEAAEAGTEAGQTKQGRKKWIIIGGAIALVAIIAIVLILVLPPKDSDTPSVPEYAIPKIELKSGMSDEEIIQTMKAKGYSIYEEYRERGWIVFGVPDKVLGVRPTGLQIINNEYGHITLAYGFCSPTYDVWTLPEDYPRYENLEETYLALRRQAEKELGAPTVIEERTTRWDTPDSIYQLEYMPNIGLITFNQEFLNK